MNEKKKRKETKEIVEYFDPNTIPPDKLIPYTNSFIFSLVMRDENICRGVLQAILPEEDFGEIHIKSPENPLFPDDDKDNGTGGDDGENEGALQKTSERAETRQEQQSPMRVETEKTVKYSEDFHGVRFDAQARSTKRWASVEMQTYRDYLGFRARSYHANMDLEALDAGSDYKLLPRSFVIFICTYDYMKAGEPVYYFQSYDVKKGLPLDDESYTIILNTACKPEKVPEGLRAFYAYINDPSKMDGDQLTQAIDKRVRKYNTKKWRERQMTFEHLMDLRYNIGKDEGREEGEDRLNRLYMLLIEQDRMEDLKKATEDEAFRKQLYQEFGLDE